MALLGSYDGAWNDSDRAGLGRIWRGERRRGSKGRATIDGAGFGVIGIGNAGMTRERIDVMGRAKAVQARTGSDRSGAAERGEAAHDDAINPSHYKRHPSGVQAIVICEHLNFCVGNAVKYALRYQYKGKPIEDLQKAIWYLQREISRLTKIGVKHGGSR